MLLVRLVSSPLRGSRSFSTSLRLSVRRARQQRQEVVEEGVAEEAFNVGEGRWADLVRSRGTDATEERLRITSFGTMRVDGENVPFYHGQHEPLPQRGEDGERVGDGVEGTGEAHMVRSRESHRPLLSSVMEEEEGAMSSRYAKYKQFSVKNKTQQDDTRIENQNFAFGKRIDNRTLVPPIEYKTDEGKGDPSDLNLIDKAVFGSAFSSFNPSEANKPRQVTVDPSVLVARQAAIDPDLNLVDQEYFSHHHDHHHQGQVAPPLDWKSDAELSSVTSQTNTITPPLDDLGFIDEQFFQPLQSSPPSEKNQEQHLKDDIDSPQSHSKKQLSEQTQESHSSLTVKSVGAKWFQTELNLPEEKAEKLSESLDLPKYSEILELEQRANPSLQSEQIFNQKAAESFEVQRMARDDLKVKMSEKRKGKKKAISEAEVKEDKFKEESTSSKEGKSPSVLEELTTSTNIEGHLEPAASKLGPKKKHRDTAGQKKPGSGGAALEYVRKLRKMEEQVTSAPVFPLGTNLQVGNQICLN